MRRCGHWSSRREQPERCPFRYFAGDLRPQPDVIFSRVSPLNHASVDYAFKIGEVDSNILIVYLGFMRFCRRRS